MTTTNNVIPTASSFLLGMLAGAAAALLFAPWSGRETRGKIRKGMNDGTAKVNEGVSYMKRQSKQIVSKAEDLIDSGKQKLAQEGHRIEVAIDAGKEAYRRESSSAKA